MISSQTSSQTSQTLKDPLKTQLVVIGSGPGGYSAAFRAADLGKKVILIERYPTLGGVCLNVGCIPSKALLHAAKVIEEAAHLSDYGVAFGKPKINREKLRAWKNSVVKKLTTGLAGLAKKRKVTVLTGKAVFSSSHQILIDQQPVDFEQAIIAVGSEPVKLPFLPPDDRVIDSTGALELPDCKNLLILGGGIIGLEMATVYAALGTEVTVVEMQEGLMSGADPDLVAPLQKQLQKRLKAIYLNTKVTRVDAKKDGLWVYFEGLQAPAQAQRFDYVLSAVGRSPNGKMISPEKAGIFIDNRGFIPVNNQLRTNVAHIFAIGDVIGQPMLAHKAVPEGRLAAEIIAGAEKRQFDARCIPSVAYTDPEIAWTGITETQAKAQNLSYGKGVFPWAASGRSLASGRDEGFTKILFDKTTHRIIGGGIVGPNAGELISEISLAIEMGADLQDIALTIHPHPTLSETVMLSAEVAEGTVTDL